MTAEPDRPVPEPKPKPPPVRSLVELYTAPGASPSKLLRELEQSPSWQFDPTDADAALELLAEHDPQLQRTRQLLHEAIKTRDGRFGRTAGDFALRAIAPDLDAVPGWPPAEGNSALEALAPVAAALAPQLRDKQRQKRAHNVLMMAVDVLSARHGLALEAAAPVLRDAVGAPPEYRRPRSNPRRHRIASVVDPRNDLTRLRDLLDLLQPLEGELRDAEERARSAARAREQAERAEAGASERAAELARRVAELESELARARQETRALSDQARDVQIAAGSDVAELRARASAFLNTRLRDLVATAKEASELDPPRAQTAARLLEQAIKEIRQEVEWLKSSA